MKYLLALATLVLFTACAVTPEQKAQRAMAQQRQEQALQVALAAQCDQATAEMMRRQFDGDTGASEKERQAFRLNYIDKTNDKMFQACYRLAWENYINQRRLERAERMRDFYDDWYWGPMPYYRWW